MLDLDAVAKVVVTYNSVNLDDLDSIVLPHRQCARGEAGRFGDLGLAQEQLPHGVDDIELGGLARPVWAEQQIDFAES